MVTMTRALIVDDDPFTRVLLSSFMQGLSYDVVGSCATAKLAIEALRQTRPHVALLDLDLGPGPTGIDLAHGLRRFDPTVALVLLTSYDDPRLLRVRDLDLPAGTVYLAKSAVTGSAVIAQTVERALADPTASRETRRHATTMTAAARLSDGQVEVMRLVASGLSNAKIAELLFITEASVGKAVARLIKQLDIPATKEQNQRVLIAQAYYEAIGPTPRGRE